MSKFPFPPDLPFSVQDVRDEFERVLDRVWHGGLQTAPLDGQDWAPRLEVYEHSDSFRVLVEIPGVAPDSVDVSILDNVLTIKGIKPALDRSDESARRLRSECRYGSFCRKYELPGQVKDESVTALIKHGVLDVIIPKAAEVVGRSVQVKAVE